MAWELKMLKAEYALFVEKNETRFLDASLIKINDRVVTALRVIIYGSPVRDAE